MLEPLFPPRVGQVLNLLAAIVLGLAALVPTIVASTSGAISFTLFISLMALGFAARFVGCTIAIAKNEWTMPWLARIASWILFGTAVAMIGAIGAIGVVAGFAGAVVLDAASGFVKKEMEDKPLKPEGRGWWARSRGWIALLAYLGLVALFHVKVAIYLSYGVLLTWSLLGIAFAVALLVSVLGPKASEAWLRAPFEHRLHEKRDEKVADPQRARAEQVLAQLRARGDAGAFLEFVRETAREAELPTPEMQALEARILSNFARAGTKREEDISAALAEVERTLSLRKVSVP